MGDVGTIPLLGALVGLIGLLVAILNIREQPIVKAALLFLVAGLLAFFFWYIAPAARTNALFKDRQKMFQEASKPDIAPKPDPSIQDEAKDIEDAQRRKEKALRDAEVFEAEQKAEEAKRERDLAAQAAIDEEQHAHQLQQALNASAANDLQNDILGVWTCTWGSIITFKSTMTFKPDGTIDLSDGWIFHDTYRIVDRTHVEIRGYNGNGPATSWDLDVDSPEQTLKYTMAMGTCHKPKG